MGISKFFGRSRSPPRAAPSTLPRTRQTVPSNEYLEAQRPQSTNNTPPRPQNPQRRVVSNDTPSHSTHFSMSSSQSGHYSNDTSSFPSWTTDSLPQTYQTTDHLPQPYQTNDSLPLTAVTTDSLPLSHFNATKSQRSMQEESWARLHHMRDSQRPMPDDSFARLHQMRDTLPQSTIESLPRTASINVTTAQPGMSNDSFARFPQESRQPVEAFPRETHTNVNPPQHTHPNSTRSQHGAVHKVTPQELRGLRELIQERYQLDIRLWNRRKAKAHKVVRKQTEEMMRLSDAKLAEIRRLVLEWDDPQCFDTPAQYEKFRAIAYRIFEEGKRNWTNEPPWLDANVN